MIVEKQAAPESGIIFNPWEGPNYKSAVPRLLIVGESHYDWEGRSQPLSMVTISVVEHWMEKPSQFFTNIVATCIGHLPDTKERKEFWQSVAFYNYIQEFAGNSPRIRPLQSLWPASKAAFFEVISSLMPELVLILGDQNWENIDHSVGTEGEPLKSLEGRHSQTWIYPTGEDSHALAFHVKHPSAGYNFKTFFPLFSEARERVINPPRPSTS